MEATFSTSLDGIIIIDSHGDIVEFNKSAQKMFGCCRDDVLGMILRKRSSRHLTAKPSTRAC
ncbi:PAS domain S-box protein [Algimonas arctica]|uniref:PAS domain S-box protein n=1 Tax=Algimonas arctica TaxID=1479486 RepID=UPI001674FEF0